MTAVVRAAPLDCASSTARGEIRARFANDFDVRHTARATASGDSRRSDGVSVVLDSVRPESYLSVLELPARNVLDPQLRLAKADRSRGAVPGMRHTMPKAFPSTSGDCRVGWVGADRGARLPGTAVCTTGRSPGGGRAIIAPGRCRAARVGPPPDARSLLRHLPQPASSKRPD